MSLRGRAGLARRWPAAAISRTSPVGGCMRPGCHTRTTAAAPTPSGLVSVCRWGQPATRTEHDQLGGGVRGARRRPVRHTITASRGPEESRTGPFERICLALPVLPGAAGRGNAQARARPPGSVAASPAAAGAAASRQWMPQSGRWRPRPLGTRRRTLNYPACSAYRGDDPPAPPAHGGLPPPIPPGGRHRKKRGAPTRRLGFKRPGPTRWLGFEGQAPRGGSG